MVADRVARWRWQSNALSGIRLWLGFGPGKSGVHSAGNGPAMRAAIFGAAIDDRRLMLAMIHASSRLTHTDPKAEFGAIAVALAAKHSREHDFVDANRWLADVADAVGGEGTELMEILRRAVVSVENKETTIAFANSLGLAKGITGYTYHTVPLSIHAWLSCPKDFGQAVTTIINCGGDADTTAAIVGGIVGLASDAMGYRVRGSTESRSGHVA